MKRAILHVGTQKTGTTSLQVFLEENRKELEKQGFFVPTTKSKYKEAIPARNAHFLMWYSRELNAPERVEDAVRAKTAKNMMAFMKAVSEQDQVLLSDETLWYEGARRPTAWKIYRAALEEAGFDTIDVVVYLRRQDDYIYSLWNQRVKGSLKSSMSCPEFVKGRTSKLLMDYSTVLANIEDVFGKDHINVRVYRRDELVGGDIRLDFCSIAGIEVTPDFSIEDIRPNLGLSGNIAEIKREANMPVIYQEGANYLRASAQDVTALQEGRETTSLLAPQLRQEILDRYAEGNERIAREYLGREDGVLFEPPASLPDAWEYESEAFARETIRFFSDALTRERNSRAALQERIGELEKQLRSMQKQLGSVQEQQASINERFEPKHKRVLVTVQKARKKVRKKLSRRKRR